MAREVARFLLVEDFEWYAKRLASQVKTSLRWNAEVVVAHSLGEARMRLQEPGRWICAIVDLRLPDGDGLQVLAAFREVEPNAPAMLLTGYPIDAGLSSAAGQHLAIAVGG